MNDFEVKDLATQLHGLHEVVEALLVWDEELEDYVFQQQFDIPMIRVEAPDE